MSEHYTREELIVMLNEWVAASEVTRAKKAELRAAIKIERPLKLKFLVARKRALEAAGLQP